VPESQEHINLVRALSAWTVERFSDSSYDFYILVDLPDVVEKPDFIAGFRPDLFARAPGRLTLVGEAKTTADLETEHTQRQVAAFLQFLSRVPGAVFVMATPWPAHASAKNLVGGIARGMGITNVELRFLPQWEQA